MVPDTRDAGYQGGLAQDPVLQALYLTDDRLGIDAQCHHHDGREQYPSPPEERAQSPLVSRICMPGSRI